MNRFAPILASLVRRASQTKLVLLAATASIGLAVATPVSAASITFDTIALTGAAGTALGLGPNVGTGVDFTNFGVHPPVLNAAGEVAFSANLVGAGVSGANSEGIWSSAGGVVAVVARMGIDGPGPNVGAGVNFNSGFGAPNINAAGEVIFFGRLNGAGIDFITNHQGVWSNAGGTLAAVARAGSDGPGPNVGAGVNFTSALGVGSTAPYVLNAGGAAAVRAFITGTGIVAGTNDTGIWSDVGGALAVVARTGSDGPGPNMGAGINFNAISDPRFNVDGDFAFRGVLTGTGVTSTNNQGIWSNVGGTMAIVARSGSDGPGPGVGAGINFSNVDNDSLVFNADGDIAFTGSLTGAGVTGFNNQGLWSTAGGTLAVVARAGSEGPGPGLGAGVDFLNFGLGGRPAINAAGEVAFAAGLTGAGVDSSNSRGIWSNVGGALALVARAGSDGPGPGLGAGVHFSSASFTSGISINAVGDVAFTAALTGAGVNTTNDFGLWVSHDGMLHNIVREGDLFDVDPGVGVDQRTISGVDFLNIGGSGGLDGRAMALNDSGTLIFRLFFTDGSSGVFAVYTMAVDCPGDTNGDGVIDFTDFSAVLSQYGQVGPGLSGDVNGDGVVNFTDFSIVLANYGAAC